MRYVIGCGRMAAVGIMILVILFILLVLFPLVGRKGRGRCVRRVCRVLMRVLGVRMTVRGAVPVAQSAECGVNGEGPGYMVCANHVSFIDIFILDAVLPCRFVAKKEIASWPVFGFIARGTGTLFIDRSRKRAVLEIADAMAGAINEGTNVLFFPEGTTGNGLELLPFHPNLFEAAVRSADSARDAPIHARRQAERARFLCGGRRALHGPQANPLHAGTRRRGDGARSRLRRRKDPPGALP